ncbi:FAD-dependent monooxygenase, partial [Pseudorhodoplanes sp.]|uniref:FAD-dependent monooxygenase n=1 Tax=Pseudorhodoplanes sp. TaxID=1934341 RepID=UPI003D100927
ENGTRHAADLIIGADGVNSAVRNSLGLTKSVINLRDGCGRYLIPRRPDDPVEKSLEYWNGGRRVGIVPASPNEVYVYLCCPESDVQGQKSPVDHESWIKSFPALKRFIERVTDNGRWASFSDVTCHTWHKGKVAIVGDGAHAMSPNLGQGACVAMQSAFVLSRDLAGNKDVPETLARWEKAQRPVVDATQRFSRLYGRIGTRWPRALLDLRSALVWGIGQSAALQRRINVAAHSQIPRKTNAGAIGITPHVSH